MGKLKAAHFKSHFISLDPQQDQEMRISGTSGNKDEGGPKIRSTGLKSI